MAGRQHGKKSTIRGKVKEQIAAVRAEWRSWTALIWKGNLRWSRWLPGEVEHIAGEGRPLREESEAAVFATQDTASRHTQCPGC